jgi:hypothetical protein
MAFITGAVCPKDDSQDWTWYTDEYSELTLKGKTFLSSNPAGFRKCLTCGTFFFVSHNPNTGAPDAKMIDKT